MIHPFLESPWSNGSHRSHCSIPSRWSSPTPLTSMSPWSSTTISGSFPLQKDHLGPQVDPLHLPLCFLCHHPILMALPYWLKPDYWRLLTQFLCQYHPLHFLLPNHHSPCHPEASFVWWRSSSPPPGAMPPIGC